LLQLLLRLWHCLYSMRNANTSPYYDHQGVDVSAVVPDGRDLAIFTHMGGMLDKKEFAHSVPADDTCSVFDQEGPNLKSLAGQCWLRCVWYTFERLV
jgi:hypothetical protein